MSGLIPDEAYRLRLAAADLGWGEVVGAEPEYAPNKLHTPTW